MSTRSARRPLLLCCWLLLSCAAADVQAQTTPWEQARNQMVDREIVAAGVKHPRAIQSMRTTPRHEFVSVAQRRYAYFDMALSIGESQTISPPFVVALMTESLDPQPNDKVLEIGTGSGYQAAVLSPLVREVYTIEIVSSLGRKAARTLKRLGYANVHVRVGDGFQGWPEHAPFDKIIVTCSPEKVPPALVAQLREGGRMVVPVGQRYQQTLYLLNKQGGKLVGEALRPTLFVPMTGQAEQRREVQPDPAHPTLVNRSVEDAACEQPAPAGWHYQRQLELLSGADAPVGNRYVTFRNAEPGRGCRAMQGFGVDGRRVAQLKVYLWVRGAGIRPGQSRDQVPVLAIAFYDENRATIGQGIVGPWRGTFPWQRQTDLVDVPLRAREAILHIGLLGAVGEISFDDVQISAIAR